MKAGLLDRLPRPPDGKKGWPWTEESKPLPPTMSGGRQWPKISIVTPSYNQGRYIEETIRSVLLQNYPALEYIVMDGGSSDESVEIIKKYEPWLSFWRSGKDGGQADAIYGGFTMAEGDIAAWINSDDYYLPEALKTAALSFSKNPGGNLLVGSARHCDENGRPIRDFYGFPQHFESIAAIGMHFSQPACFWKRRVFFEVGGFEKTLRFCFDYEMFLRLTKAKPPMYTRKFLAVFREHEASKTALIPDVRDNEKLQVLRRLGIDLSDMKLLELQGKSHTHMKLYSKFGRLLKPFGDLRALSDLIYKMRKKRPSGSLRSAN